MYGNWERQFDRKQLGDRDDVMSGVMS
jgi:hypothetical protein